MCRESLVTFGNRAYDNALAELVGLMEDGGMKPVGAPSGELNRRSRTLKNQINEVSQHR